MFVACLLFYYFYEILNIFKLDFRSTGIFYTVHDLYRLFFLLPVVYASYYFGIKGAVASAAFIFVSLLPRAFFASPYPNPLLRMAFFCVFACIIGVLTARAAAVLCANETRFRRLFDNMGNSVAIYETHDNGNTFIFNNFNKAGENIDHIKKENLIGKSVTDVFPGVKESGLFEILQQVWRTGLPERHPVSHYVDGRIYSWKNHYAYKLPTGEIVAVCYDITEYKRAEEQLNASLREKEILLREVHHRVKNNMQVISGLLDLQAKSNGNPELINMLHKSQDRIRAMALVHERLYASNDFAKIDLVGYARALSQDLFQSYSIDSGKIDLIIQADDGQVDINKAIPCGLILNELISNALKHAFPGDGPGEIKIIIHETENVEIEIVVCDNGLGLPDDIDIHQARSVGLYLVNGLVKNQLDGQINVTRDAGTEFRIKIPL